MEIYTMTQRPSMPLTRACAPSAAPIAFRATPVAFRANQWPTVSLTAPAAAPVAVLAAERAPVSRVHQAQAQAELAQVLMLTNGITGTNGTTSTSTISTTGFKGIDGSSKRYTDGADGVPPRGRPV
ncbi:hypothetical protein ACFQS1_16395 [Paractinoplanes rhizophilus]|jgi:hypothetical protein|uniref:Antifreeze protein n=1 Tax=Paractinoplanes rhizophilus TaxID=1416877 RepID=A0ABW2HRR0_9ACTN|nr:hypothetical protein [Actinoplanes sp.]